MFDISLYNDEFFEWHDTYARQYSIDSIKPVISRYNIKSMIDFGCGIGSYLEGAFEVGVIKLKGYDIGKDAAKYTPEHLKQYIEYRDATEAIKNNKYDLVLSTETAEHIEPSGSEKFVKNLVSACGKMIILTAAPPGQLGCGHINCQPKGYWITLFERNRMQRSLEDEDIIRAMWKGTPQYIQDNLLVFIK